MTVFLTRGALSIGSPWSHAVWAVLDHHRAMGVYRQQQRDHVYNRVTTSYTPTVSILVLGLGYMGTEIATKLATFGFDVRGWSRSHKDVANVACHAGQAALFDAAAVGCHYVINALPLTPETTAVLNDRLFRKLHRGACVINMGRGGHVVTRDLLTCLSNGQLSHAYLDVFDDEPLPKDHPIWDHPQVTVTPHIAGELLPASCAVSVAANIRKYSASAMAAVEPGVS
jgi:glyoxylate/hydroxypyruvate reductase A